MAWARIDDHMPEHPRMVQAGPLAMAMQLAGICYCNRNLTDGFVPAAVVPTLLNLEGYSWCGRRVTWKLIVETLVREGAWVVRESGWEIHDYLVFQPSRAQVQAERDDAKRRMCEHRAKRQRSSQDVRPNNLRSSDNPDPDPDPDPDRYISVPAGPHPEQPPMAASGAVAESTTAAPTPDGDAVRRGKPAIPVDAAVKRVMDAWNAAWTPVPWPKPKALTPKRQAHILARLRSFGVDELCAAVANMRQSEYHTGANDRGWVADPEFLFRSRETVERFLSPPQPEARASPAAPKAWGIIAQLGAGGGLRAQRE